MLTRAQLEAFIRREREAAAIQHAEMLERPLAEQVEAGEAIANLTLESTQGTELWLHAPRNDAKFRFGDQLRLRAQSGGGAPVDVVYMGDSRPRRRLVVRAAGGTVLPAAPWVLEGKLVDMSDRLLEAVGAIFEDPQRAAARTLLEGDMAPKQDPFAARRFRQRGEALKLTPSQTDAFAQALACENYATIKGPPGCGKTYVIARIVAQAVADGLRVLVTAQTHKAVNNALAAIHKLDSNLTIVKYGSPDVAVELDGGIRRVNRATADDPPIIGPGVVGAVLVAAGRLGQKLPPFDLVLCDEASQVTLPLAACGLMAGRRWVFVGDERQLPPVVIAPHEDDPCARSIFAHLHHPGAGVMLAETFRLNRGLTDWVSKEFYEGRLKSSMGSMMRQLKVRPGGDWRALLDPKQPLVIAQIAHTGHQSEAPPEAMVAAALIEELIRVHGLSPTEVGVLSPFRAQNRLIRAEVERRLGEVLADGEGDVLIDTVERAQGQEREAIVVSLAASDPDYIRAVLGFWLSPERLNVMITRARTKCILLVSPEVLAVRTDDLGHVVLLNRLHRLFREMPVVDVTAEAEALASDAATPQGACS